MELSRGASLLKSPLLSSLRDSMVYKPEHELKKGSYFQSLLHDMQGFIQVIKLHVSVSLFVKLR